MGSVPPSRLSAEIQLYETRKAEWLRTHPDEYVVIKGTELFDFFSDFNQAYRAGVEKYGIDADFLVKRVVMQEPVFVVF